MRRSVSLRSLTLCLAASLTFALGACGDDDVTPSADLGATDAGLPDLGTDLGARDLGTDAGPVACTVGCNLVQITAGVTHTCVRRENGEVLCWGDNYYRELGDNNGRHLSCPPIFDALPTDCQARPVVVAGITDATDIQAHLGPTTCGRNAAGAWKCWGSEFIATGSGQPAQLNLATAFPRLDGVATLGPSWGAACGVTAAGAVTCFGGNQLGQLGDGTTTERHNPVEVTGLTGVVEVHGSGSHTCARLTSGSIQCWGTNESGQLGDGSPTHSASCRRGSTVVDCATAPVTVSTVDDATALTVGGQFSCALRADGTVWCWGGNAFGQLGNGTLTDSNVPVQVAGVTGATAVDAGGEHTCALVAGGAVKCWGLNFDAQLGDNAAHELCTSGAASHDCSKNAVDVPGVTGAIALGMGSSHSCVLFADGVSCWGDDTAYQAGVRDTERVLTPTRVVGLP